MAPVRRFDHVGITVADLDSVTAFFVGLGLEVEGPRMPVESELLDTVIGRYEDVWLMAYVRGPEGIIVSLADRIG